RRRRPRLSRKSGAFCTSISIRSNLDAGRSSSRLHGVLGAIGMRIVSRVLLGILAAVLIVAIAVWGSLALYYRAPFGSSVRQLLAALFALLSVVALAGLFVRSVRRRTMAAFLIALIIVLLWWRTIEPRNDRDWQPEVAVLPYADIHGDMVTLHNIRN